MVAMDLPKGIVVNTPGISSDVERINEQPLAPETIAHFWKVYTTTRRTLRDPTAERLENYWWRIWGSRQRELRGATVAQLFVYISNGSTFNGRPLLSKINRFEGDFTVPRIQNGENEDGNTSTESSKPSDARSSSSSRGPKKPAPPMPHPILKKSRGPSSTGPHPTARFVSPHGSDDEGEKKAPISPNEHVVIRPPTPELKGEKETQNTLKVPPPSATSVTKKKGKGHVVTSVAGRRRPTVVRRKSSQSSAERSSEKSTLDTGEKAESGDETEKESAIRHPFPTTSNTQATEKYSKKVGSSGLSQQLKLHGGKPPDESTTNSQILGGAGPGPSSQLNASQNSRIVGRTGAVNESGLNEDELRELELQKLILAEGNARVEARKGGSQVFRQNLRSMSLSNLKVTGAVAASSDVKGKASVAPRYVEAIGEVKNTPTSTEPKKIEKGKGRDVTNLQFPKRTLPSLSGQESSILQVSSTSLMSKSQSQLALLIQKDKARTNESNGKGKGKGKGKEKHTETGSEQDEVLEIRPRERKKR